MELQGLDFIVEHISDKSNIGSNALSRLALESQAMEEDRVNISLNERSPFESDDLSAVAVVQPPRSLNRC